jgi:hypothetical protein
MHRCLSVQLGSYSYNTKVANKFAFLPTSTSRLGSKTTTCANNERIWQLTNQKQQAINTVNGADVFNVTAE